MRVGSLVFATEQGLGYLARDFYRNGVVTDAMILRHGKYHDHTEWYPGAPVIGNLRGKSEFVQMCEFCSGIDVMFFFETPFLWTLIDHCRTKGVKTVLMPMHECHPCQMPSTPDLLLCPSKLDLQQMQRCFPGVPATFLPVPVSVPWRLRERAEVFVHNAGHGGLRGRNGTTEILEAIRHVKSQARFIIRSQSGISPMASDRVRFEGSLPYEELWNEGDVFLFPEKFNGLSLPMQEARAVGMLVMGSDRFPMNDWLPCEPLIPVSSTSNVRIASHLLDYDEASFDPYAIAARIDEWYGRDISGYSLSGREWAKANSWEALRPCYTGTLESLL